MKQSGGITDQEEALAFYLEALFAPMQESLPGQVHVMPPEGVMTHTAQARMQTAAAVAAVPPPAFTTTTTRDLGSLEHAAAPGGCEEAMTKGPSASRVAHAGATSPIDGPDAPAAQVQDRQTQQLEPGSPGPDLRQVVKATRSMPPITAGFQGECLIAEHGGLRLALPMQALAAVLPAPRDYARLPGQVVWMAGVVRHREHNVPVVTVDLLVARGDEPAALDHTDAAQVVVLGSGRWALHLGQVQGTRMLCPQDYRLRAARNRLPWLAGYVVTGLVSLIDVHELEVWLDTLVQGAASDPNTKGDAANVRAIARAPAGACGTTEALAWRLQKASQGAPIRQSVGDAATEARQEINP